MNSDSKRHLIHDEWEHGIKPQFDHRGQNFQFNMPFECLDHHARSSMTSLPKVTLTSNDIKLAFDPVMDKIFGLVENQICAVGSKMGKDPKVPSYIP